MYLSLPVPSGL